MKLWRNNKVDQEYTLSTSDIADKFMHSSYINTWQSGYRPLATCLCLFIGDSKEGLSSVFEENDPDLLLLYEEVRQRLRVMTEVTAA